MLDALDRKLLRDLARMRGQLIAIALVIACGVGLFVGMRSTMASLDGARADYYAKERFGHVFANLKRAPEHVARKLRGIPGVLRLQTRVVADVTLDVPGMTEAVTGRLISLPDRGRPEVDDIRLRSGRLPDPTRPEEVLISEAFAEAHGFPLETRIGAIIDGKHERLLVVGTALSPEYTYTVGPGMLFPDDRRFGIVWMQRAALGPAFDMEGAFNSVTLQIAPSASADDVIRRVDGVLDRYGGLGAIPREDQQSAFFVDNELEQLRSFGMMVPILFLLVAAFLLNIVVGRIVNGQREQIAALKALGYFDREIGWHYTKLVGLVSIFGAAVGLAGGSWLGSAMTRMYAQYYRFPELPYQFGIGEAGLAIGITLLAASAGTLAAIRRTMRLPPAEAMRPESPPIYRATIIERWGLSRLIPPTARIVLREIERKPGRALLSVLGISLATSLMILSTFTFDAVNHIMNVQFGLNQREDVQLSLFEPRSTSVLSEIEHLPGVIHAEPFRSVPVRLRFGPRLENSAITGIPRDATLQAVLDRSLRPVELPEAGLVLSRKLAEVLGVTAGDTVEVAVLEGERAVRDVRVSRLVETFIGVSAYMALPALCALLHETPSLTGAWLTVDDGSLEQLHAAVKATPTIAGITTRDDALASLSAILDESIGTSVTVSLVLSLVMAFGVLYNAVRITLAERSRDLASLRVLGFRRREVAAILFGENAVLVGVAIPIGLLFGWVLAAALVESPGFNSEQFRLPLVIAPATYGLAVSTVLIAAVLSCWSAWRKLDRIDIVEVLKARD